MMIYAALKKEFKLPQSEHPQSKEILQEQKEKEDMMQLIIKLTAQIKDMESQLDIPMKKKKL